MRTNVARAVFALALLVVVGVGSYAMADSGKKQLKADQLVGYQENPDISTVADGSFEVTLDDSALTLTYTLSYSGLEGRAAGAHPLRQARDQRRRHRLPLWDGSVPGAGGQAGVPAVGHRLAQRRSGRHPPAGERGRHPGHRGRQLRGARGRAARRTRVRERPLVEVAWRRDPRPDQRPEREGPDRTAGGTRRLQAGPLDSYGSAPRACR